MAELADVIFAGLKQRREEAAAAALATKIEEKPADEQPVTGANESIEVPIAPAEGDKQTAGPIAFKAYRADDGVIYGIAALAGNVDLDDEVLRTKALVKMSYDFTAASQRVFKANHKDALGADLVASMTGAPILKSGRVLKYGEDIPADDPMVALDLKAEPIAWVVGVRPHDRDVAEKAKAGEIAGFSWGAYVERQEV